MNNYLFSLNEQSCSIVPIVSEKASFKGWDKYTKEAPSEYQISCWATGSFIGWGLIAGYGDIHVLDFDTKNLPEEKRNSFNTKILNGIPEELQTKLVVQKSASGGFHFIYKCKNPVQKEILIKNPDSQRPVIETIGPNNYVIFGKDGYEILQGSLDNIQTLTSEEHLALKGYCQDEGKKFMAETFGITYQPKDEKILLGKTDTEYKKDDWLFISASAAKVVKDNIDLTPSYQDWVLVGYSVANTLGENGRTFYHQFSSQNPEYNSDATDNHYDQILKSKDRDSSDRKFKIPGLKNLLKKNGVNADQIAKAIGRNDLITKTIEYLQSQQFYRNEFTGRMEREDGVLLTDKDIDTHFISLRKDGYKISKTEVTSIINSNYIKSFNPLELWLNQHSDKDFSDEVFKLMDCLKFKTQDEEEQKALKNLFLKWLLQIPAVINKGKMARLVLVIIGPSHIGKTEFLRRLLPEKVNRYYAESSLDQGKDTDILLSEYLLVNIDEMGGIVKSSKLMERFKSLVSAKYFTLRVPFGHLSERLQRKAVLCGTSNKIEIIMDLDAENTRIIPLELRDIDREMFNSINKDILFRGLANLYKEKEDDYTTLSNEDLEVLKNISPNFTRVNFSRELILQKFEPGNTFMTITKICEVLSQMNPSVKISPSGISQEMKRLGFLHMRKRIEGSKAALSGFSVSEIVSNVDPETSLP